MRLRIFMINKQTKFYIDLYTTIYKHEYRTTKKTNSRRAIKLIQKMEDVRSVLDVGCSFGWAMKQLRSKRRKVAGIEVARQAVEYCKRRGLSCKLASATDIPWESNEFDLVMAIDILEHLRKEDVSLALKECCRVARKYFVFQAPNKLSKSPLHWFKYVSHIIDNAHLTREPQEWWIKQVEKVLSEHKMPYREIDIDTIISTPTPIITVVF